MGELQYTITFPIVAGIVLFLFPEKLKTIKGIASALVSCIVLYFSYKIFKSSSEILSQTMVPEFIGIGEAGKTVLLFNIDNLSKTIVLFIGFFGFLFSLYSLSYVTKEKELTHYYPLYLITLGSACGAVLADHFLLFLSFWGVLGLTLYKLMSGYDEKSSAAAKKTFILIGASDSVMIFGVGILWRLTDTMHISTINLGTTETLGVIAFIALFIGSITKAGAFPFHSWVPDYVEKAPASSSAFLPASLD